MTTPSPGTPRRRPRSLARGELGFRRRRRVAWLSPGILGVTTVRLAGAYVFGAYLDKRELQGVLPGTTHDHVDEQDPDGEFWLDYVSDIGDGFDAGYSVAWTLSRPTLDVGGERLPRGRVLVMGGDQVYPTASYEAYEDRFQGPYRSAFPANCPDEPAPTLYALPGNHDWYDGLTAFLRMFGRQRPVGGWRTRQERSYFALRLPHRWWLLAVDAQLSSYIDSPQLSYFKDAARGIEPGDRVLLCVSEPDWIRTPGDPDATAMIDYFMRTVLQPTGATCEVLLSGDRHHYARYAHVDADPDGSSPVGTTSPSSGNGAEDSDDRQTTDPPRHLMTCGAGGAYLADTAGLPESVRAPSARSLPPEDQPESTTQSATTDYRIAARYPSAEQSRAYGRGIFAAITRRNPGFATAVGILHVLLLMAFLAASNALLAWATVGASVLTVVATTALAGRPKGDTTASLATHRTLGIAHGIAHLGLAAVGSVVWSALPFDTLPWVLPGLTAFLVYGPVAALAGSELVAAYLWVAARFGVNDNELFAAQGIENSKAFLRLRFAPDGSLTIYPIGLDRVCRRWRPAPEDEPTAPWIAPRTPLVPHLIEGPVRVPPPGGREEPVPGVARDEPTPHSDSAGKGPLG